MLLPGFAGTTLPDDYRALLEQGLGGICYFGSNTADGPAALAALSAEIRAANPAAVVAVDEEGGDVSRLHTREPSPVLGAAALGGADDLELTEAVGRWVGHELAVGRASPSTSRPDADVNSDPDNPVIGTRSFGVDPEQVAAHVAAWTRGLQSTGVAACAKHFPGHGDTATDSHLDLPRIDVDPDTLAARELVPFDAAVEAGTAAVMTSHIVVPAIDPDRPATLSPLVLGMLREVLGFDGVIVSDALDMAGASAVLGIPEAAVLALAAGCDLLCLGPDKPAALVLEVRDAIVAAVADGRLAARPARGRRRVASPRCACPRPRPTRSCPTPPDRPRAAASATRVDGDAARPRRRRRRQRRHRGQHRGRRRGVGPPAGPPPRPGSLADGLPDAVPGDVPLVVQVRDADRRPEVLAFLRALAEGGRPAVVVEWGWPSTVRRRPRDHQHAGLVRAGRRRGDAAAARGRVDAVSAALAGTRSVGLDIGGTKTHGVVLGEDGTILAQVQGVHPTRRRRGGRDRGAGVRGPRAGERSGAWTGRVGVGVPGLVDSERGMLRHAVNLDVNGDDLPLRDLLAERLGVPVVVENDVNAAALAACALVEADDVVYLSVGTGLAAGLVVDGRLRRGEHGAAGEIGHLPVDPAGEACGCGQTGCLETIASGRALARAWPTPDGPPAAALFAAAAAGDPAAVAVRDRFCWGVASAVRALGLTIDPERIVLGGGVAEVGEPLREQVVRQLRSLGEGSPFLASLGLADRLSMVPLHYPVAAVGAALVAAR